MEQTTVFNVMFSSWKIFVSLALQHLPHTLRQALRLQRKKQHFFQNNLESNELQNFQTMLEYHYTSLGPASGVEYFIINYNTKNKKAFYLLYLSQLAAFYLVWIYLSISLSIWYFSAELPQHL